MFPVFQPNQPVPVPTQTLVVPPSQNNGNLLGGILGLGLGLGTGNWAPLASQFLGNPAGSAIQAAVSSNEPLASSSSSTIGNNSSNPETDNLSGEGSALASNKMIPQMGQPLHYNRPAFAPQVPPTPSPELNQVQTPQPFFDPFSWW